MASAQVAFSDRVRALRQNTGLSQEHFADRADISRGYMWKLENGKTNPSLDLIVKIATALDMSLADLFAPMTGRPEWRGAGRRRSTRTTPR
jgi:transcriptional regulator with XRE-family HTH domain